MAFTLLTKIFGSRNDRLLKQYRKTVERINALEAPLESLSDEALRQKTEEFKARVAQGEALDEVLPEAFAVVREASKRVMKMRHFDVQLIGGIALHQGKIAEMRTGEGKTLTATLPVYLNALSGKGVHLVTVNDYLARRDAQWYAPALDLLGITIGVIQNNGSFRYTADTVSDTATFEHLLAVPRAQGDRAREATARHYGLEDTHQAYFVIAHLSQRCHDCLVALPVIPI